MKARDEYIAWRETIDEAIWAAASRGKMELGLHPIDRVINLAGEWLRRTRTNDRLLIVESSYPDRSFLSRVVRRGRPTAGRDKS